MCEVGVWKNYEELEDQLILDELFELYEGTTERQVRMMKTIAAALGAGGEEEVGNPDDTSYEYAQQEIAAGGQILLGYRIKEETPGE